MKFYEEYVYNHRYVWRWYFWGKLEFAYRNNQLNCIYVFDKLIWWKK